MRKTPDFKYEENRSPYVHGTSRSVIPKVGLEPAGKAMINSDK